MSKAKPQPKPLPLQKPISRQEAVPIPRDVPQIRPLTPDRPMPDIMKRLPQPFPDRQMPTPPPQQGTPEQRNAMLAYQQANYPIGLGGYLGQGPQFGGPDPRFSDIDRLISRPSTEPMINPEVIKKAKNEYLASLPKDLKYSQVMTKTKYGGEFDSSIGSGFDKWFEQNYINNPKSSLSEQERMGLQGRMKMPEFGDMESQIRAEINARNGGMAGPQFGLGQIPNAGFGGNPQFGGPQFGGPKLGYLGSETQLGMGPQFGGSQMPNAGFGGNPQFGGPQFGGPKLGYLGSETQLGMGSGMQDLMGSGQQDEMRKKMMESLLNYNKQSQANMMGGFGQPIM
jgi:hypothetical protein